MRDPVVALYVVTAVVLALSAARVRRVSGARSALATAIIQLAVAALAAVAMPLVSWFYPAKQEQQVFVGAVIAAQVAAAVLGAAAGRPYERLISRLAARPRLASSTLMLVSVALVLGGLEVVASSLVRAGLSRRYTPTETRVTEETEDWRLAHIMSDDYREPDPVLLWRPVARAPYTQQRFRGPVAAIDKPAATTRIICYGDSNTDGPPSGGAWPEALDGALARSSPAPTRAIEVLNAGVTGYSSYQGRRRFEQEGAVYRPDVVLVAFGWNDAATSISAEDKSFAATEAFQAATPWVMQLRRLLFRYDAVLVAARWLTPGRSLPQATGTGFGPRVSLADYTANLTAIVTQADRQGAKVVLMTRPHRETPEALTAMDGWRQRVPAYNDAARRVAAATGTPLVDAQQAFLGEVDAFLDESHLTRDGHVRLTELTAEELVSAGLVQ